MDPMSRLATAPGRGRRDGLISEQMSKRTHARAHKSFLQFVPDVCSNARVMCKISTQMDRLTAMLNADQSLP
ncbi:hypothetical protein BD410DRAFT_793986 [Rickenella mellea]|uniref:Uncharacterized protein n=1 Tax=Rickenella mellea TaxID=50990 RepID=A0A4Y7PRK4_9AGAM|nr:hypothetical protein BD410DRAFT_793986 [Rickenella mellea]